MISYEEALQIVLDAVTPLSPIELPLDEAAGLVLAVPAAAAWEMPRFDNSAMDGFAIAIAADGLERVGLRIVGDAYAGHPFHRALEPGEAVRITTGALLPQGADRVVPIEMTEERDGRVFPTQRTESGQHVRFRGEEFRQDDVLAESGTTLRAGEIAMLASAGVARVVVRPRPRVAMLATGDELVELGRQPGPGQIVNSNLYLLKTRLLEWGAVPLPFETGADDPDTLERLIDRAGGADMILSTGGVSVGAKDLVQGAFANRGFRTLFWKVAVKPGKPVLFGMRDHTPCFGLPGNPAAAAVAFELFARPALAVLSGRSAVLPARRRGILADKVRGDSRRQAFVWCHLDWNEHHYRISPCGQQGSGQNSCLAGANALLPIPAGGEELSAGDEVDVILLDP